MKTLNSQYCMLIKFKMYQERMIQLLVYHLDTKTLHLPLRVQTVVL